MQKSLLFQIIKKNFIQSNLVIKNEFQSFKTFIQIIKQFFHTSLLKTNVIFFFDILTTNFPTFEKFIQTKTIGLQMK